MKKLINLFFIIFAFHACALESTEHVENTPEYALSKPSSMATPLLDKAMTGDIDGLVQMLITRKENESVTNFEPCKTLIIIVATKEKLSKDARRHLCHTGRRAGFDELYIIENPHISTSYYMFIYTSNDNRTISISNTETREANHEKDTDTIMSIFDAYRFKESIVQLAIAIKKHISRCTHIIIILPTSFSANDYNDLLLKQSTTMAEFQKIIMLQDPDNVIQHLLCIGFEKTEDGEIGPCYGASRTPIDDVSGEHAATILANHTDAIFNEQRMISLSSH